MTCPDSCPGVKSLDGVSGHLSLRGSLLSFSTAKYPLLEMCWNSATWWVIYLSNQTLNQIPWLASQCRRRQCLPVSASLALQSALCRLRMPVAGCEFSVLVSCREWLFCLNVCSSTMRKWWVYLYNF